MILRALKANHYKLFSPVFTSIDEVPTASDATAVCAVVTAAGATLTAPTVTAITGQPGRYWALLTDTVHTAALDELTVTWTGDVSTYQRTFTQTVEVVGGHYVSIAEIRAEAGMDDAQLFPSTLLAEIRAEVEDVCEQAVGWAFVPRFRRESFHGSGTSRLELPCPKPTAVLAVTVDGTAQTVGDYSVDATTGEIVATAGTFPVSSNGAPNVVVAWTHGESDPPPKLRREVLKLIRNEALARTADQPSQVIAQTYEGMTLRYSTPDPRNGRPTGVLSLDPVLVSIRGPRVF